MLISKFSLKSGALAVAIASGLLLSACGEEPKTAEAPTEQAPAALEQAQPVAEQAMAKASEAAVALQQGTGSASSALSAQIAAVKAISAQVEGFALQGNIYAGGVPSKEQMQALAAAGVKTVIDFRKPSDGLEAQQQTVAELGLNYVNIPVGKEIPAAEVHQQFAEAFAETANDKVLLHCRSGNRVGMMWSMYQISQGIEAEQAIAEGRAMGMKPKFEEAVRATL